MRCDFHPDKEATLICGYYYCSECARARERLNIHNTIGDTYPSLPLDKIKEICAEMFGTDDYGFSLFSRLYKILDRGKIINFGPNRGYYVMPQPLYLVNTFSKYIEENHPNLWRRIKDGRIERFY